MSLQGAAESGSSREGGGRAGEGRGAAMVSAGRAEAGPGNAALLLRPLCGGQEGPRGGREGLCSPLPLQLGISRGSGGSGAVSRPAGPGGRRGGFAVACGVLWRTLPLAPAGLEHDPASPAPFSHEGICLSP